MKSAHPSRLVGKQKKRNCKNFVCGHWWRFGLSKETKNRYDTSTGIYRRPRELRSCQRPPGRFLRGADKRHCCATQQQQQHIAQVGIEQERTEEQSFYDRRPTKPNMSPGRCVVRTSTAGMIHKFQQNIEDNCIRTHTCWTELANSRENRTRPLFAMTKTLRIMSVGPPRRAINAPLLSTTTSSSPPRCP